ncbi:MAG: hypothetical protein WBI40_04490 [Methylococcaceae bacterium]
MTAFNIIILVIGIGLLLLGSVSGIALFKNAIKPPEKVDIGLGTLWSLFITGLSFGILLAWWALP